MSELKPVKLLARVLQGTLAVGQGVDAQARHEANRSFQPIPALPEPLAAPATLTLWAIERFHFTLNQYKRMMMMIMAAYNLILPNRKQAIRKGVFLGMLGAFVICTLSTIIAALLLLIVSGPEVFSDYMPAVFLIAVGPAPFIVTVVPAGLAGGIDALILHNLARKAKLRISIGLRTGSLTGLAVGFVIVTTLLAKDIMDNPYNVTSAADLLPYGIPLIASIFIGLWHGWRMMRYLQAQGYSNDEVTTHSD